MTALEKAQKTWLLIPSWLEELCRECDCTSLRATAQRLGLSPASLSLVINNKRRQTAFVAKKVQESLEARITCPLLGNITAQKCKEEQLKPFLSTNPVRIQQYKTCKACKNAFLPLSF